MDRIECAIDDFNSSYWAVYDGLRALRAEVESKQATIDKLVEALEFAHDHMGEGCLCTELECGSPLIHCVIERVLQQVRDKKGGV